MQLQYKNCSVHQNNLTISIQSSSDNSSIETDNLILINRTYTFNSYLHLKRVFQIILFHLSQLNFSMNDLTWSDSPQNISYNILIALETYTNLHL